MIDALANFELKTKYDDTVECGNFIYKDLPYEFAMFYQKHKKILVVSPRDLIVIAKTHRISKDEVYILSRSITHSQFPENKNIVRAITPMSCWHIKVKEPGSGTKKPLCKMTFFTEVDFKISLFI